MYAIRTHTHGARRAVNLISIPRPKKKKTQRKQFLEKIHFKLNPAPTSPPLQLGETINLIESKTRAWQ